MLVIYYSRKICTLEETVKELKELLKNKSHDVGTTTFSFKPMTSVDDYQSVKKMLEESTDFKSSLVFN